VKRGFMDFVATNLIPNFPGQTSSWYAKEYLKLFSNGSEAKNRVQSLASTLNKQVQTGLEKRVWRKRVNGIYRYFPASMLPGSGSAGGSEEDVVIQMRLSKQELEEIDNLVAVDKFRNRNDAIKWLVIEGMTANRAYLDRVKDAIKQIEQLKREVDVNPVKLGTLG